jgi:chromosomal replication initiator protein
MAIKNRCTDEFRRKFSNADFFLLDDLHFLGGKAQTLECVFHTFNELYDQNCQIVLASDRHPRELTSFHKKLRSRLEWGLVIDLSIPDSETRLSILREKAKKLKATVPAEVLNLLATNFKQNVRELEGALNRVVAYAKLSGKKLDSPLAMTAIQDLLPHECQIVAGQPNEGIIGAVASYFGLTPNALIGKKRDRKIVLARHVAMYLLREHNYLSLSDIGRMFGNRDHSTVLHAYDKIAAELNTNSTLAASIQEIYQHAGFHKSSSQTETRGKATPNRG